ncbi:hypothetical protein [Streptomyces sp. A244]|uniref:hypothetical protein n=1 Tax=Streptomyces sp. A244 TaxID=2137016 RepID=UPI0015E762A3
MLPREPGFAVEVPPRRFVLRMFGAPADQGLRLVEEAFGVVGAAVEGVAAGGHLGGHALDAGGGAGCGPADGFGEPYASGAASAGPGHVRLHAEGCGGHVGITGLRGPLSWAI